MEFISKATILAAYEDWKRSIEDELAEKIRKALEEALEDAKEGRKNNMVTVELPRSLKDPISGKYNLPEEIGEALEQAGYKYLISVKSVIIPL